MTLMTPSEAFVETLAAAGVTDIFGIVGSAFMDALDIFPGAGIRFISVQHEQNAVHMADGYARASGRPGTAMVVPGPGLMNASAAIGTAYAASSPVLVIAGQVNRDLIGVDRGILHEVNDQQDIIRPVTKAAYRVLDPAEIPAVVREAFRQLRTGRPRPVEIEIPNPEMRLLSGMVARVGIDLEEERLRMLIPREVTIDEFGLRFVWVVERVGNERLVRRRRIAVRSLAFRPADFEVVSGLAVGEEIAVTSMRRLREDETVHVGGVTSP